MNEYLTLAGIAIWGSICFITGMAFGTYVAMQEFRNIISELKDLVE